MGKRKAPLSAELLYLPLTDEALIEQHLIASERKCSPDTFFRNDVLCICISGQAALKDSGLIVVLGKLVVDVLKADGLGIEPIVHLADPVAAHLHIGNGLLGGLADVLCLSVL